MALALGAWAASTGFWPLAAFALAFGAFYGGWVALLPALVMDRFDGRNIAGILYTSVAVGTLVGPSAAGFAYDASGCYTLPMFAGALANVAGACVLWRATPGSVRDRTGR